MLIIKHFVMLMMIIYLILRYLCVFGIKTKLQLCFCSEKSLNFKHVILSVLKHPILDILFVKISVAKPFNHDFKRKVKTIHIPRPTCSQFMNPSDTGVNIVTNARTL